MRQYADDEQGPGRFVRVGLVLIVLLAVVSVTYNLSRAAGPSSELEGLHSARGAAAECRRAIEAELGVETGPLAADTVGAGEYEVRGTLPPSEGASSVLCEVLFDLEDGWVVLDVEAGG